MEDITAATGITADTTEDITAGIIVDTMAATAGTIVDTTARHPQRTEQNKIPLFFLGNTHFAIFYEAVNIVKCFSYPEIINVKQ
jgi:hypothetical protein